MPTKRKRVRKPPPDLPLELWLEIFQFSTYVHRSASIKPLNPFAFQRTSRNVMGANTPALAMYTKLALVQVCHAWRNLALPILYEHVVIRSPGRAKVILRVLQDSTAELPVEPPSRNGGYGQWTRHIEILTHARGSGSISYLQTIFSIFQRCPNIRILSGVWTHPIPPEFLKAVSKLYGPTLEGLCWSEVSDKLDRTPILTPSSTFDMLASFKALRILDLRHVTPNKPGPFDIPLLEPSGPKTILPLVEHLIISSNSHSLRIAAYLSLPNLCSLTIKTPVPDGIDHHHLNKFLAAHGACLQSVDLPSPSPDTEFEPDPSFLRRSAKHINPDIFLNPDTCPNLTSISFPVTSPVPQSSPHPRLRRIGLRGVNADSLYPGRQSGARDQLFSITAARYPNLQLIQTIGFLVEADVDSLIKDVFIWWVERFEKMGVDLLDGEGVLWAYTESDGDNGSDQGESRRDVEKAPSLSKERTPEDGPKLFVPELLL